MTPEARDVVDSLLPRAQRAANDQPDLSPRTGRTAPRISPRKAQRLLVMALSAKGQGRKGLLAHLGRKTIRKGA